jgi:hypothetical protein
MDFLKKHYEKLILGLVLLGLAGAAAFLPIKISSEKADLQAMKDKLTNPKVQPLTNLDMTAAEAAVKLMATPELINFSEPNKLFNPMPWQKTPDGRLIPAMKVGPNAITVTNIVPLYLKLTLDQVEPVDPPKYVIGVEKQAASKAADRHKKQTYCLPSTKYDVFTITAVRGTPNDPSQLVLTLNDTGEQAIISKDKPFLRVDGYMADLKYELERKSWINRRVGQTLTFNGEDYNIVAINQNEVVLSAIRNQKKWTIKYNNNPGP